MLDLFRKKGITSFVYGGLIVATIAVFVIQFRPSAGQKTASLKQACVAEVRGGCVDPKDFRAVYRVLVPRGQDGAILNARAKQMGLSRIVGDALVERELLVSEAERLGLKVTEEQVTQSIFDGQIFVSVPSDRPELLRQFPVVDGKLDPRLFGGFRDPKTKQFDMKTYERTIRALMGRSPSEFREEQAREMLAAMVRDVVRAPIRVSEADAFDAYVRERTTAAIAYVPVKLSWAARYLVTSTPAEVDAWLKDKANADLVDSTIKGMAEGMQPKAGHYRHILIKTEKGADASDKSAALAKTADAVRRVQSGELFAEVAKDVSQDYGSATQGGDVGDKTDPFVLPFKKAADALKPGEMTPQAVETQFGFHIIKKDDPEAFRREVARSLYVKGKALDAAKGVAAQVQTAMKSGKSSEEAVQSVLAPLARKSPTWPDLKALREAAGGDAGAPEALFARSVTVDDDPIRPRAETSGGFNRGGDPIRELGPDSNGKILEFAFSAKAGDMMGEPLRTDDGLVVVQLKEQSAATREQFDKERDTYLDALLTQKRAEALALYVTRLKETHKGEVRVDETYLQEPGTRDGGAPAEGEEEE